MKAKRLFAAFIDYCVICAAASAVIAVIGLIARWDITNGALFIYWYLCLCVGLLTVRDFAFRNASIGKRLLKLRIVKLDSSDLRPVDLFIRNIPCLLWLWPLEILLIVTRGERLGDTWSKTEIVPCH